MTLPQDLYAHTLANHQEHDWEPLSKHLREVSATSAENAAAFGGQGWGEILGECHDLGKASEEFQQYLRLSNGTESQDAGVEDGSAPRRVDHSTYGAQYVANQIEGWAGRLLAFCIAGHHCGLANDVPSEGSSQGGTLRERLSPGRPVPYVDDPALTIRRPHFPWRLTSPQDAGWSLSFFTRMLFSSLVDADRTCTEAFCEPGRALERAEPRPTLCELNITLTNYINGLKENSSSSPVNQCRREVLQDCVTAASLPPGFFSLQVPTGGGKTLSSLAFGLRHASIYPQFRRVIVAIPFTSIIEQTADVYRRALAGLAERALIEHHTNIVPQRDTRANQFGTENWDAPLIVTTNVQLLESMFAAATTPCRKLHRIAGSIIILDEAQTLPVDLLIPTLVALRELVEHYGCSVVLCTATQPALEERPEFPRGLTGVRPIVTDAEVLFDKLKRVNVQRAGKLSDQELALRLFSERQVLCIVNTRSHASRLYDRLSALAPESCFHLSTLMCGAHRRIALRTIRERLDNDQPCRVVSTQLIEAGVDIDLPVVYRADAGFDSIAQAAGRCNREGKLEIGVIYVFEADQEPPPGLLREGAQCARELFSHYPDPLAPEAIRAYFERFYWGRRDRWDSRNILSMFSLDLQRGTTRFQFRDAQGAYRLIDDQSLSILIPFDQKSKQFLADLLDGHVEFVVNRELQPYLVSVPERALRSLERDGIVAAHDSGVYLLLRRDAYTENKGLLVGPLSLDPMLWGV